MHTDNLFTDLPPDGGVEVFEDLIRVPATRIERIVSRGHRSPDGHWYDQPQDEWVLLLAGRAVLEFADGTRRELGPGDHVNLPAHLRHRVAWTSPSETTIWLAVYYQAGDSDDGAPASPA